MATPHRTEPTIRQAIPKDADSLSDLACLTYTAAFGDSMAPEDLAVQLRNTRSPDAFRTALATDTILIASIGDRLAGYVQICDLTLPVTDRHPRDQQIEALYVQPDLQGLGIGQRLLQAALNHRRVEAADNVYLDVWEENRRAMATYSRAGFETVGRHDVKVDGRIIGEDLIMVWRRPR
jgi:ribosomal protein S18 acetylase RimI-like enzyme